MKALTFHEFGGTDKLRYEDVPDPTITPEQVLVRVRACALNHLDLFVREGKGWKLSHHQAGPVATPPPGAGETDPDQDDDLIDEDDDETDDDDDLDPPSGTIH